VLGDGGRALGVLARDEQQQLQAIAHRLQDLCGEGRLGGFDQLHHHLQRRTNMISGEGSRGDAAICARAGQLACPMGKWRAGAAPLHLA
jgi:hypothetical protein